MYGILVFVCFVGSFGLHAYTAYLAYVLSGGIAAIITMATPGFANLYWIYERWSVTGEFLNYYTKLNILALGVYFLTFILLGLLLLLGKVKKPSDVDLQPPH
jgi:hypothetical protein